MVAQRKATSKAISTTKTTTSRRRAVVGQAQQTASSGDDVDPPRDLLAMQQLRAMRADALAWVHALDLRIETLERMNESAR